MESIEDVPALKQRIITIEQEISKLTLLINNVSKNSDDSDDDMYSEDSPWVGYLSKLSGKLDKFSRDRLNCEQILRKKGISIPSRDDD